MKKSYYLSSTFNEVIFQNRNKVYGAYNLRRIYEKHIIFAVLVATATFASALAGPLIKNVFFPSENKEQKTEKAQPEERVVNIETIPLLPEQPKEQEQVVQTKKKR